MSDEPKTWPGCGNCGKPAYMTLNDFPVCIDCKFKHDQGQWMQMSQAIALTNHADRELALMAGMPHLANPIEIPRAPMPPITYNNQSVTVTGGNVGVINTGNVNEIQVNLQSLTESGAGVLVDPLKQLTEAILSAQDADVASKNELLEQVAVLTEQAKAKPEERKGGMVKAVFSAVKEGASAIGSVAGAWTSVEGLLRSHFGLGA